MGLLSHVTSSYLPQKFGTFSLLDFSKKYKMRACAIFSCVSGKMLMTDCIGFDAITVSKSVSSLDFWSGTIGSDSKWYSFDKNEFVQFFQFLSFKDAQYVKSLHFLRVSNDVIFMAAQTDVFFDLPDTDEIKKILPTIYIPEKTSIISGAEKKFNDVFDMTATIFTVSVNQAAKAIIDEKTDVKLGMILERTIYRDVFYKISQSLLSPNKVLDSGKGIIKVVVFSAAEMDEALFKFHLTNSLADILDSKIKYIVVEKSGVAATAQDIKSFI